MLPKMDENKGGIVNQGLVALDDVLMQRIMPVLREYYKNVIVEGEAHKRTLKLLQDIKAGRIDMNRVVVTDDGWRLTPERVKTEIGTIPSHTSVGGDSSVVVGPIDSPDTHGNPSKMIEALEIESGT